MGMFARRGDREVAGLRAEAESLQSRLASDVSTLDPGDSALCRQAMSDASERNNAAVLGMNWKGPTARSHTGSPSSTPPSVSLMACTPGLPSRAMPMIGLDGRPSGCRLRPPKRLWLLSMCAIPASVVQDRWHPGCCWATKFWALP